MSESKAKGISLCCVYCEEGCMMPEGLCMSCLVVFLWFDSSCDADNAQLCVMLLLLSPVLLLLLL
jgi:hypothetical protein